MDCQFGKVGLQAIIPTKLEAKRLLSLRVEQIVSVCVDYINPAARVFRLIDPGQSLGEIDINDHEAEGFARRSINGRSRPDCRLVRHHEFPSLPVQINFGKIDRPGRQLERFAKIIPVALPLQLIIRHNSHRPVGPKPIDPHDLAAAIRHADDAKLRIARLGLQVGHKTPGHPHPPHLLGGSVLGVAPTVKPGPDNAFKRRCSGRKSDDIIPRQGNHLVQAGALPLRMRLHTGQLGRQNRFLQVPVDLHPHHPGGGKRQKHHRKSQSGSQRHVASRWVDPVATSPAWDNADTIAIGMMAW